MAAKKIKFLSNEHRLKIQTSQIINRLQSFVNSEIELSPAQVSAALGLLKKSLPDLSATELTGEGGGPIKTEASLKEEDRAILDRFLNQHKGEPK